MTTFHGLAASAGVAHGFVVRMPAPIEEPEAGGLGQSSVERAQQRIDEASGLVVAALEALAARPDLTAEAKDIVEAESLIASDPMLVDDAKQRVSAGLNPPRAVWDAGESVAAQFEELGGRMAQRAADVRDVRARIVAALLDRDPPGVPVRDTPYVLVADDLAPADTAGINPAQILAIVTRDGGLISHTAILARDLGLPAVVGLGEAGGLHDGDDVLVDGTAGVVIVEPSRQDLVERQVTVRQTATSSHWEGVGATSDGHRVALLANVGDAASAQRAAAAGAEGVGLFRTEFCFLDRKTAPSVDEQAEAYRTVFEAFAGRDAKVVIRTLDAGADKPLPFLHAEVEPNPALGVRGYRVAVQRPEIMHDQLQAIDEARRGVDVDVWVMAPLIATVEDARGFVDSCAAHGLTTAGVMVEVPSAAILADEILAVADFASIGTNDLTQYVMAADRQMAQLSGYLDPWQPALLRLIAMTGKAGGQRGKPVGVCGEAASNPALAAVLVGSGVTSLSMSARALPAVAEALSKLSLEQCQGLAELALASPTAWRAREVVAARLASAGEN
ncbi:MAG: phosphoenolpyruvate--protein phosphotransferase [Propionibacteriaceae bacterium]|jgi:phosphotransferase system enzyme I (PtsI)|nr:phosphoenolpyruvate--protein phosphotransferase [Propionibacteriaceae bacterium]